MEESESRIEDVARDGPAAQSQVARRILEEPRLYQLWESEHNRIMRTVAAESRPRAQITALRNACFGLIHRKALFEYLREYRITGRDRHAVFALIHGEQDYVKAVLFEHGNYVRSASSFMCSNHVGLHLMADRAFGEPLLRYEALYADYFRAFCASALSSNQYSSGDTLRTLVPYLKDQLGRMRRAILSLPPEQDLALPGIKLTPHAANARHAAAPFRAA